MVVDLHDVVVRQRVHDTHFCLDLISHVRRLELRLVHLLYRVDQFRLLVNEFKHLPKRPLP